MSVDAKIARRFDEVAVQGSNMHAHQSPNSPFADYEPKVWQQWATSAQNVIEAAFGSASPHARNFATAYAKCHGHDDHVDALKGIFAGAKADYVGGYGFKLTAVVSGEIYGDFVGLAKKALDEGHKDVAAVLACAALEDVLKRLAAQKGLDVADKDMQQVVNALKAAGAVAGAQKTLLDSMPKVRDYAMHAKWSKITPQGRERQYLPPIMGSR